MQSRSWLNAPWAIPMAIAAISAASLAVALISQYGFGLWPCELCIWQRYPYVAAIALGLFGAVFAARPVLRRASLTLAALVFVSGAGIAGFHVGVEQGWWQGLPGCTAGLDAGMSAREVLAMLETRQQVVPCDEPAWTFAGVSMAGYNGLLSLALAAFAGWGAKAR
jgi:disulfide bond formation protein DsbB